MLQDLTGLCCYVLGLQMQRVSVLEALFTEFQAQSTAQTSEQDADAYLARRYHGPPDFDELLALLQHQFSLAHPRAHRKTRRLSFLSLRNAHTPPTRAHCTKVSHVRTHPDHNALSRAA